MFFFSSVLFIQQKLCMKILLEPEILHTNYPTYFQWKSVSPKINKSILKVPIDDDKLMTNRMPYGLYFSWGFAQLESFSAFFFLKFHSFLVINENFLTEVGCMGCDLRKHTYPKSITLSFEKYIGLDLTWYLYLLLLFHCVQDNWKKKLKEVGIVFVQCWRGFSLSQQGKQSWAA